MKKLKYKFFSAVIVGISVVLLSTSYAGTTYEDISLSCPTTNSFWVTYCGEPNVQCTLVSKGMGVPDKSDFVTDWVEYAITDVTMTVPDGIGVSAVCGSTGVSSKHNRVYVMDEEGVSSVPLICAKGQSLSVRVLLPKCSRGEYKYVGSLIKTIGDGEEVLSDMVSPSNSSSSGLGSSDDIGRVVL